jgi:uncharacterized protein YidB (DUF937 family)
MSLFDSIARGVVDQMMSGSGTNNNLLGAAAKLVNSSDIGGLSGLMQLFTKQGQGDAITSWISTGKNLPISPDAIQKVLGDSRIQELAGSLGLSASDVSRGLANVLPQLVDQLTPNGSLPAGNEAGDILGQLAKKFLGG